MLKMWGRSRSTFWQIAYSFIMIHRTSNLTLHCDTSYAMVRTLMSAMEALAYT